jgi:hypothetical protein
MKLIASIGLAAVIGLGLSHSSNAEERELYLEMYTNDDVSSAEGMNPDETEGLAFEPSHHPGDLANRARIMLAGALSAQETMIGIKSEQHSAWVAYTTAVLAMLPSTTEVKEAVKTIADKSDIEEEGLPAFARSEFIADRVIAKGDKARALKEAITALRGVLTPEQLEQARIPAPRLATLQSLWQDSAVEPATPN